MSEIEVLELNNIKTSFKSHFHKFYVIGFIKSGHRKMLCNDIEYFLSPGDMVIFNPFDVHSCEKFGDDLMEYFAVNIEKTFIENLFKNKTPNFQNVIKGFNANFSFEMLRDKKDYKKVLKNIPHSFKVSENDFTPEIEKVCKIIEQDFSNKISLEFLSAKACLSKSSLLRAFAKQKGITPYRYLECVRLNNAKKFLSNGLSLLETANLTGFFDQSHFANCFKKMFGLAPGIYQENLKIHG